MSELKARHVVDVYDDYAEYLFEEYSQVYIKSEADKVIADLEESHKKEVGQLLMEIVELKEQVHDYAQGLYVMQARAEMELRHHKYHRCLDMAARCESEEKRLDAIAPLFDNDKECWEYGSDYWNKWHKRWLKIAESFKEAK